MRHLLLVLLLGGCDAARTTPSDLPFRAAPYTGLATPAPAPRLGTLEGEVYSAQSTRLDPTTSLPEGYGPIPDGEGRITVMQVGARKSWSAAVASGSYQLGGLPLGLPLEVTASRFGYRPRTRTLTLGPRGYARMLFAAGTGDPDSYLVPAAGVRATE